MVLGTLLAVIDFSDGQICWYVQCQTELDGLDFGPEGLSAFVVRRCMRVRRWGLSARLLQYSGSLTGSSQTLAFPL
ncbi:hypothetical protein C8R43DRAFT_981560, partial [Mycena crocata]